MSSTTAVPTLPVPAFFDAKNSVWDYRPDDADLALKAVEYAKQHGIKGSGSDKNKVHLLLIDVQKDFCFPEGSLYVGGRSGTGAVEDSVRTAEFIYKNLNKITEITCTMDSHFPFQIFSPNFWVDKEGKNPPAHTIISYDDVAAGTYKPNPGVAQIVCNGNYTWLVDYCKHYCKQLEKEGKYQLYLWPYHCLLGTQGYDLVGIIQEARIFHSFARCSKADLQIKGGNLLTENYSVLSPEVEDTHDGRAIDQKNVKFIKTLLESDVVIIAGQAASHCVKSTIDDLLTEIKAQDPELAKKVYIMKDCMSSVAVPDGNGGFIFDFTDDAEKALNEFEAAGMNVVESTTPMDQWPGM